MSSYEIENEVVQIPLCPQLARNNIVVYRHRHPVQEPMPSPRMETSSSWERGLSPTNMQDIIYPVDGEETQYEPIAKVGRGTFGQVFKALDRNGKIVAMKRFLLYHPKKEIPVCIAREIEILSSLRHENVLTLLEVVRSQPYGGRGILPSLFAVTEYCEHDLAGMLGTPRLKLSLAEIKGIMRQLFIGLDFLHRRNVMHRDLKPANVLITQQGVVKLADFGLARYCDALLQGNCYTTDVVTLWYRSPELLLGARMYGPSVDMWSAGCLMGEIFTRHPIIKGISEQQQLQFIARLCGSLTPTNWPGIENFPIYRVIKWKKNLKRRVKEILAIFIKDENACDLIDNLLVLHPKQRLTAERAVRHKFFDAYPRPCSLAQKLSKFSSGMFDSCALKRRMLGRQNIAKKRKILITEPVGDKCVKELSGIGKKLGDRLIESGFDKAYTLLGKFLVLKRDENLFKDWLREECFASSFQASACSKELKNWCEVFL